MPLSITDIMLYGRSSSSFLTDTHYEMFTMLLTNQCRVSKSNILPGLFQPIGWVEISPQQRCDEVIFTV